MEYRHTPVLLNEVLEYLDPQSGEVIVDGTLGAGGHAIALAERIGPKGKIIGIDLDPAALAKAEQSYLDSGNSAWHKFIRGNYKDISKIAEDSKISSVDKILVDVGISSYDLEGSERGFSFQKDERLDMRFDPDKQNGYGGSPRDASYLINTLDQTELERIFKEYGEDKFSRQIAMAIVRHRRENSAIGTTTELLNIIKEALPISVRFKSADSARRIFQALRIEVNEELDNLKSFLPEAFTLLKPGGRLAVISFHSLEDRMVKNFFKELTKGCICPIDFPICQCGKKPLAHILTKKIVIATEKEIAENPRSKPAKLRVIQKI